MNKKMKILFRINILVTVLSLGFSATICYKNYTPPLLVEECVPTEIEAIAIGKIICGVVYPQFDYGKYSWDCYYNPNDEAWHVGCYEYEGVLGGGLPEVHIKKSDGKVVFVGLGV